MEEGPDPPCLPYSDLELRQSGMTRSEAAQILTGARDLRRLSADACLFHGFENRAPSGRFTSRSHQITAFTGARRPASGDAEPLHRCGRGMTQRGSFASRASFRALERPCRSIKLPHSGLLDLRVFASLL